MCVVGQITTQKCKKGRSLVVYICYEIGQLKITNVYLSFIYFDNGNMMQ